LTTQSAAGRRAADAELRGIISKFEVRHQRLIRATRRWVLKRVPTACEVVYEYRDSIVISYSPNERGYEGVFAIRASTDGVRLYLNNGKGLADPEKMLRGSAKARWIDLEAASTLASPAVAQLVDAAIARNSVPFAATGRSEVVIRSKR
jgi:hypothetical protein